MSSCIKLCYHVSHPLNFLSFQHEDVVQVERRAERCLLILTRESETCET